jgi:pyrimidine deaminase RibD-like protein
MTFHYNNLFLEQPAMTDVTAMTDVLVSSERKASPTSEPFVVGPIIVHNHALLAAPTRSGKSSVQQSHFEKLWHYQGPR